MLQVSNEYKNSMKSLIREQGYIKVNVGLINQDALKRSRVVIHTASMLDHSDTRIFFKPEYVKYATIDDDYMRVDGTMLFLPEDRTKEKYEGLVTVGTHETYEIRIELFEPSTIKGMTIEFGDNYPVDFDIVGDKNTIKIRNNDTGAFKTEEVINHTAKLRINILRMNKIARVRIHNLILGFIMYFTNDKVINAKLDSYVSPISEKLSQTDFTVTLTNYDKYFDVNNKNSAFNFIETGQPITVSYGYKVGDNIEWLEDMTLYCSSWEHTNTTATINAMDSIRDLNSEFYKGRFDKYFFKPDPFNIKYPSLYDVALEVIKSAGIAKYEISEHLKNIKIEAPVPRVSHKEALQMIANASCSILIQKRDGTICIKENTYNPVNINFRLEKSDIISEIKSIKQDKIKEIVVKSTWTTEVSRPVTIIDREVQGELNKEEIVFFDRPYATAYISNEQYVEQLESGSHYIKIKHKTNNKFRLHIQGNELKVLEQTVVKQLNTDGKVINWNNPLINSTHTAEKVANWLAKYYQSNIEYEYTHRGYPELEANDVIYQDNDYIRNLSVNVYNTIFEFNGAFKGVVKTRKVGG